MRSIRKLSRRHLLCFCQLGRRQISEGALFFSPPAVVELCHRGLVEVDGDDSFK